jgi:hypothetical protein
MRLMRSLGLGRCGDYSTQHCSTRTELGRSHVHPPPPALFVSHIALMLSPRIRLMPPHVNIGTSYAKGETPSSGGVCNQTNCQSISNYGRQSQRYSGKSDRWCAPLARQRHLAMPPDHYKRIVSTKSISTAGPEDEGYQAFAPCAKFA